MSEIILTIVIIALLVFIAYTNHENILEREKLVKIIKAKDLLEVTDNEAVAKMKPSKGTTAPSDLVAIDDLDDDSFDKLVRQNIQNATKQV